MKNAQNTGLCPLFLTIILVGFMPFETKAQTEDSETPSPPDAPVEPQLGFELPRITPGPTVTLADALKAADQRNVTLAAAKMEIAKTEAKLSQAWALVLPGAQAKLGYQFRDHADKADFTDSLPEQFRDLIPEGEDTSMLIMPRDDLKGSLEIGMSLINVQSWMTISAAKKGVELARMSVEQGRQQLLLGVTQAYYMALMAWELIGMYEGEIRSSAHHVKVAKARFDAGTGLRIDVIRAETDLDKTRQELISAHLAFDNARDAIGVLMGMEQALPMPTDAPALGVPQGEDDALSEQAVASRPDIKAKQATVALMDKQLKMAWAQFLPTVDAGWGLQYQFSELGALASQDRSRWAAMFTLTVPLYNHFRYGNLDEKRASLRQAMLQQEDAMKNAGQEVRKARRDYLASLTSVQIAERQERLAKEALTLVEASFNAGTGSSLDVTDARRTSSSAIVNLAAKRLQSQISLLQLLSAVGEDMMKLADSTPTGTTPPATTGKSR